MAEIINLRQKRKEKARSEKDQRAEANRRAYGQSKSEKQHRKMQEALDRAKLDQHKIED